MTDTEKNQPTSSRPRPEYGEYAPEGWVSTHLASKDSAQDPETKPAPATSAVQPSSGEPSPERGDSFGTSSGRVPGVPHNLGAGGENPPAASGQSGTSTPPQPPQPNGTPPPPPAPTQQNGSFIAPIPSDGQAPSGRGRGADRVITIVLLVVGALGALYSAASMQQLPTSMSTFATALGAEGTVVPDSVTTLGTVGALAILAIYALNLIFSIQRLRAHKITFWVPLAAGVIAMILVFTFTSFAINQVPEVAQLLADPDALSKLLSYLGETAQ